MTTSYDIYHPGVTARWIKSGDKWLVRYTGTTGPHPVTVVSARGVSRQVYLGDMVNEDCDYTWTAARVNLPTPTEPQSYRSHRPHQWSRAEEAIRDATEEDYSDLI
jgi:hypothetical protein